MLQVFRIHILFCLVFGLILAAFMGCSDSRSETTGTTSETTNGIAVVALDGNRMPVPQARVTLFESLPSYVTVLETATADDSGKVLFETQNDQCQNARCYIEGIAGEDSSLMVWTKLDATDSVKNEIELLPSVSLTIRMGMLDSVVADSLGSVLLDASPYYARQEGNEFVFSHVPAGKYTVVMGGGPVAEVSLDAGAKLDTLVRIQKISRDFVFEDFDDGDSLNNLVKGLPNYGWYYIPHKGASFERPDSAGGFAGALIEDDAQGKYLSMKFSMGDSGYVALGSRLGLDSVYYDLSTLTAVRLKVRGDCMFAVALEHYRAVENNNHNKTLWFAKADDEWTEIVLRPGEESLNEDFYQVAWDEISNEIGIFSIFIYNGSLLEIDEIVFEGVQISN